ncbi:hypothetical protein ACFYZ2_18415 [Streptomyces sviceus]
MDGKSLRGAAKANGRKILVPRAMRYRGWRALPLAKRIARCVGIVRQP